MSWVRLRRGAVVESRHRVHAAVADPEGGLLAAVGDPEWLTFLRSAAKPFQALPLVEDGAVAAFRIPAEELALCCGSHGGEPAHIRGVRRLLARCGVSEEALACGAHLPTLEAAARELLREGGEARPIHNNCSGKHAGMLALAAHHGWPLERYEAKGHPVQERVAKEVARWTGVAREEIPTGIDGCGVVTHAVPLRAIARGYAALGRSAGAGERGAATLVGAMCAHPFMVAGTGRLCTRLMEAMGGRLFAKVGAEGVYGVGVPEAGLAVAVKVEDGAGRAAEVAILRILDLLGILTDRAREELIGKGGRVLPNTRGEPAAFLEPDFDLVRGPSR